MHSSRRRFKAGFSANASFRIADLLMACDVLDRINRRLDDENSWTRERRDPDVDVNFS